MTGGTNPVAIYGQTNFTTQTPTAYKTQIDSNSIVAQRVVDCFAPRQTATPAMTVTLDPGYILRGTTLTEVASQTTGTITAPTGNPRIDRVVVDRMTGAASVVTGTPAASPAPPAIPSGKLPICQVQLQTTSTTITNAMITDERVLSAIGRGAAGEEGIGQWLKDDGAGNLTLNVNATLRDDGTGKLTTGLTTEASITSASTTDLGTLGSNIGVITGSNTINALGNSASTANPLYIMRVSGAPLITNTANLILPGAANYQCAAGDILFCKFEGASKWRVFILKADGTAVVTRSAGNLQKQSYGAAGTYTFTTPANTTASTVFKITLTGAGAAGGGGSGGGGGGAGETIEKWVSGLAASTGYTIVIGAGGTGSTGSGTDGGNSTFTVGVTTYTAHGGAHGTTTTGGLGGTGGNGDNNYPGGNGGMGFVSAPVDVGGAGGGSRWGSGGSTQFNSNVAENATVPGAGGSGHSNTSGNGGNGADGWCVIEWVL